MDYELSAKASSPIARRTSCGATSCSAAESCASRRGKNIQTRLFILIKRDSSESLPFAERKVGSDEAALEKNPVKLLETNYVGVYSRMLEPHCSHLDLKKAT